MSGNPTSGLDMRRAAVLDAVHPASIRDAIDRNGFALTEPLLDAAACAALAACYDGPDTAFRSTVNMSRHGFGRGEYKYFAHPLPPLVAALRRSFYRKLVPTANGWNSLRGETAQWPPDIESLAALCAAAGQSRPTPLLLRYAAGDFNCLHQDLYGAVHFPLQAILLLDRPGIDFEGGELILVEQRARRQSTPAVVPLVQGAFAVIPVKERPVRGVRSAVTVQVRHGVSQVRSGLRRTLGLIFHDAA